MSLDRLNYELINDELMMNQVDRLNYELIHDELMMNQVWTQACLSPDLRHWHHPRTARDGGAVRIPGLQCLFLPLSDYANSYISSSQYSLTVAQLVFTGSAEINLSEFLPPKQLFFFLHVCHRSLRPSGEIWACVLGTVSSMHEAKDAERNILKWLEVRSTL